LTSAAFVGRFENFLAIFEAAATDPTELWILVHLLAAAARMALSTTLSSSEVPFPASLDPFVDRSLRLALFRIWMLWRCFHMLNAYSIISFSSSLPRLSAWTAKATIPTKITIPTPTAARIM